MSLLPAGFLYAYAVHASRQAERTPSVNQESLAIVLASLAHATFLMTLLIGSWSARPSADDRLGAPDGGDLPT